jgi:hypothetical protein
MNTAEFNVLNSFEPQKKDTKKINQVLIAIELGFEKGPSYKVTGNFDEEDLSPASIYNKDSFEGEIPVDTINFSTINIVNKGAIELEMEDGEIMPIDLTRYKFKSVSGDIISQQKFEILTEDIHHKDEEKIILYPLGTFFDSGMNIKKIEPIYFYVSQDHNDTKLRTVKLSNIQDVGGIYSTDGFMHEDQHYVFYTKADSGLHQSFYNFIKSGGIKCTLHEELEAGGAAAGAPLSGAGAEKAIQIQSCEIYDDRLDSIIIGFDMVQAL